MGVVPTVRIKTEEGFVIINKDDLNLTIHDLYVEKPEYPKDSNMTIEEAIKKLDAESTDDFTGGGLPRVSSVEKILGRDVTADEVKAAWENLQEADKG